jgi:hypothetical protein
MYMRPLPTIALAMLGVALSAALTADASAGNGEVRPDANEQLMKDIYKSLRHACATQQELQGILIKDIEPAGDGLRVKGFVDQADQRDKLKQNAPKILADVPGYKGPVCLITEDMKVLQIRDKFLTELQKHFANNNSTDDYVRAILRSTRVDGAYFDDRTDTLVLTVASIYLGKPTPILDLAQPAPPMRNEDKPEPNVENTIKVTAQAFLEKFLATNMVPDEAKKSMRAIGDPKIQPLEGDDNPILLIQNKLVKEQARDDVLCTAHYDADGILQVEGIVGSSESYQEIEKLCKNQPRKLQYSGVTKINWPINPARLQQLLSQDKSNLLRRQTRIDRVYLTYSKKDKGLLRLWFQGISCYNIEKETETKGIFIRDILKDDLLNLCCSVTPNLKSYLGERGEFATMLPVGEPWVVLQRRIAARKALDGTFLSTGAYFDGKGNLCLCGLLPDANIEPSLKKLAKEAIEEDYERLCQRMKLDKKAFVEDYEWRHRPKLNGRLETDMHPSHTPEMLKVLREYSEKHLDSVWLDRLYFDDVPKLHLTGFEYKPKKAVENPEQAKEGPTSAVDIDLNNLLTDMKKQHPELNGIQLAPVALEAQGVSPAAYLRQLILAPGVSTQGVPEPIWDGVLIERGYYTVDGVYSLAGLVDNDGQRKILGDLLKKLADTKENASLFPATGKSKAMTSRMEVIPLKPMITGLKRVMPAYETFDNILLERAYHDSDKKLVLLCAVAGKKPTDAAAGPAEKLLTQLFTEARPEWKRRSGYGISLKSKFVLVDVYVRDKAFEAASREALAGISELTSRYWASNPGAILPFFGKCEPGNASSIRFPNLTEEQIRAAAFEHFTSATGYFDIALLHDPGDSTTWYLRALCYFALGDTQLAKRDLARNIKLERTRPAFSYARTVRLEQFQGELRYGTTKLMDELYIDPFASGLDLSLKNCP